MKTKLTVRRAARDFESDPEWFVEPEGAGYMQHVAEFYTENDAQEYVSRADALQAAQSRAAFLEARVKVLEGWRKAFEHAALTHPPATEALLSIAGRKLAEHPDSPLAAVLSDMVSEVDALRLEVIGSAALQAPEKGRTITGHAFIGSTSCACGADYSEGVEKVSSDLDICPLNASGLGIATIGTTPGKVK